MQIWTNPVSFEHTIELLKNTNVDILLVGKTKFNICNNFDLSDKQLNQLIIKNNKNKKIIISINKVFHENEINELKEYLLTLKNKKIDGILFKDFGVKQICDEIKLKTNFIYAGNTLVVNYGQFPFYKKNGIKTVMLSNELFLNEIKQIQNNKYGLHLLMQVEGYTMIAESKWKLLSAYKNKKKIESNLSNKQLYLKEETRNDMNIIYEDEHGTYLFSGYNLSCLEKVNDLTKIDSFFINSLFHDKKWVNQTIKLYHKLISKKMKLNELIKIRNKINRNCMSTLGFLDAPKGLLHLKVSKDEK